MHAVTQEPGAWLAQNRVCHWALASHVANLGSDDKHIVNIPFALEGSISRYSLNMTDKGPTFHFSLSGKKGAK